MSRFFTQMVQGTDSNMSANHTIEPIEESLVQDKRTLPADQVEAYRERGLDMIRKGKCCAVVLAGGQGTRLGFDHAKGMFTLPKLQGVSIFEILIKRFIKVQMLAHGLDNDAAIDKSKLSCRILIMTSKENHAETVEFIANKNKYFGASADNFLFFQ